MNSLAVTSAPFEGRREEVQWIHFAGEAVNEQSPRGALAARDAVRISKRAARKVLKGDERRAGVTRPRRAVAKMRTHARRKSPEVIMRMMKAKPAPK